VDAVVVATPVSSHYAIARRALLAGKHVLVEKPLASSSEEGQELIRLAKEKSKILMVGHTFEYNPAVLKVGELIQSGGLGQLYYIDAARVNLGRYQTDGQNVLWDLAPHDLSIILSWVGKMPRRVSAYGQAYVQPGIVDVAFIRLEFENGVTAQIHVSWLAPAKIRRMAVIGSEKMVLYDDLDTTEKIKIADRSAQIETDSVGMRVDYRMGDIVSPHVDFKEPLTKECEHFIECILNRRTPLTDGENGARVVRLLEAADLSIKKGGASISL
jgi:predicted dehydrogenase